MMFPTPDAPKAGPRVSLDGAGAVQREQAQLPRHQARWLLVHAPEHLTTGDRGGLMTVLLHRGRLPPSSADWVAGLYQRAIAARDGAA